MADIQKQNTGAPQNKAMTLEELQAVVESHKNDLYTYQEKIKTQDGIIEKQQTILNGLQVKETSITTKEVKKLTIPEKHVTHEGKEYKWQVPHFNLRGQVITAEDAATDPEIIKELVGMKGQGLLKEQV